MTGNALLRRNLRQTLERFAPILGVLAVGAVLMLAMSGAMGRAVARSASALDSGSALSVLQLSSIDARGPAKPLTGTAIDTMRSLPGVQEVRPSAQLGISVLNEPNLGPVGVLWATPRAPWVQPRVVATVAGVAKDHALVGDEVYLPNSVAGTSTTALLGKHLTVQYTRATGAGQGEAAEATMHVVGAFDNATPGADGEAAIYVSDALFRRLLGARLGLPAGTPIPPGYAYPTVYVKASSTSAVPSVQAALAHLGFNPESLAARTPELSGVLRWAAGLDQVLGAGLLAFCVGVGASLGGTWSSLRRWDVGVLSSLGWSAGRILRLYTSEVLIVGLVVGLASAFAGCVASLGLGLGLASRELFGATFGGGPALPSVPWLVATAVGIPLALVLGAVARLLRLVRLAPDVALRRSE